MPWKVQGGGPWGGGGGGGGGNGGNNPFRGGGRGPQPPDIEEMLRRSQDKVKKFVPGGGGIKGIVILALVGVLIWGGSGIYRVNPGEQGVELLFGKFVKRTGPGLHFWPPVPIGDVIKPNVERTTPLTSATEALATWTAEVRATCLRRA